MLGPNAPTEDVCHACMAKWRAGPTPQRMEATDYAGYRLEVRPTFSPPEYHQWAWEVKDANDVVVQSGTDILRSWAMLDAEDAAEHLRYGYPSYELPV